MMLKKALASSGKKLIKVIKSVSRARLNSKLEQLEEQRRRIQAQRLQWLKEQQLVESDLVLQWTRLGFDYLAPAPATTNVPSQTMAFNGVDDEACCCCCCCCELGCDERDENQRNENLENEMLH